MCIRDRTKDLFQTDIPIVCFAAYWGSEIHCVQIVLYRTKLVLDLNTIESRIPNKQQNTQWDCQSGIDL